QPPPRISPGTSPVTSRKRITPGGAFVTAGLVSRHPRPCCAPAGSAEEPWGQDEQEPAGPEDGEREDSPFEAEKERHPLPERALGLLVRLHDLFRSAGRELAPSPHTLFQGAGDAMGGLAQALSRAALVFQRQAPGSAPAVQGQGGPH